MCSSAMEDLPCEMVVEIAQFLAVKDLAAACAVSTKWREIFGCDQVWKSRCETNVEEHLRTSPCRVHPKFESPEDENTTLSPIGHWRIAFMRECHLWKNWIQGNYTEDEIRPRGEETHLKSLMLNDNFLLISWHYDDSTQLIGLVQLIDLRCSPTICVAQLEVDVGLMSYDTIRISEDTFMIKKEEVPIIEVIKVDLEAYTLSVKYTLDTSSESINYIDELVVMGNKAIIIDNVDKKFLCFDLEKNNKLKLEAYPEKRIEISEISYSKNCSDIGISFKFPSFSEFKNNYCMVYSVNEFKFFSFRHIGHNCHNHAILQNYIAIGPVNETAEGSAIKVYNYHTSQLLFEVPAGSTEVITLSGRFFFTDTKCSILKSLSPTSGTTINHRLKINVKREVTYGEQDSILVLWLIGDKLILNQFNLFMVDCVSQSCIVTGLDLDKFSHWDVWYEGKPVNQAFSRCVIWDSDWSRKVINVLNFW